MSRRKIGPKNAAKLAPTTMTQIIALMTRDYVMVAADRRLTDLKTQKPCKEEACKLVSLCNCTVIAYSGYAELDGLETHDWIARHLLDANCVGASAAGKIIRKNAMLSFQRLYERIPHTFLLAGWTLNQESGKPEPFFTAISNVIAADGCYTYPGSGFSVWSRQLQTAEDDLGLVFGTGLDRDRSIRFERRVKGQLHGRQSPSMVMHTLIEEIVTTSRRPAIGVNERILSCCLPAAPCAHWLRTGTPLPLPAAEPNPNFPSFGYFVSGMKQPKQFAPTVVCGTMGMTRGFTEAIQGGTRTSMTLMRPRGWPNSPASRR